MEGKPYAPEGIGDPQRSQYLDTHWPAAHPDTGMQGWAIRLPAPLDRFFTPMSTFPDTSEGASASPPRAGSPE